MADERSLYAILIPYYITEEFLAEARPRTGDCGKEGRTQTPLGDITPDTNLSGIDGVVGGEAIEFVRGETKRLNVGRGGSCGINLPQYLDFIGFDETDILQAYFSFDGQKMHMFTPKTAYTNSINGKVTERLCNLLLNPTAQPTLITLGDRDGSQIQQTQAVLKIEYNPGQ